MICKNPTWVEISKSAFDHNVSQLKSVIGARQLAAVVKANAYGHGMHQIASLAQQNPCIEWLCVALASEAISLQKAGIRKPIIVIGCIDVDPVDLVNTNIHLMIDNHETTKHLNTLGKTHNYAFPIHIKIDTGLSRFGVSPETAVPFIKAVKQLSFITVQGLYSHFSEAQKADNAFTNKQVALFQSVLKALKEQNIQIPLIHLANSAAITTVDLPFCNLFRIGLSICGLWSSPETKKIALKKYPSFSLQPVATWKARILGLKTFPQGSFIGYDRTFKTPHPMRIATIPIGYYDGYDLRFSNNATTLVNNQYAPVVGRVAMNTTAIDVTNIQNIKIGDELILMGNYPNLHPYDLGMRIQNLNVREIISTINPNIPRIICDY